MEARTDRAKPEPEPAKRDRRNELDDVLHALDRLMRMFTVELYVYLLLTTLSFLILMVFLFQLLNSGNPSPKLMIAVFG